MLQKIKKSNAEMVISLKRTVDILGALGEKDNQPFLVGFAAESDDLHIESQKKLQEKKGCKYPSCPHRLSKIRKRAFCL